MLPQYHLATQFPQVDVSFREKLLKIVATRGETFNIKFTKSRLAAGLRPDPLRELKCSPRPPTLAATRGPTSKGEGEEKEGKGREAEGKERKGKGRERKGLVPPHHFFALNPCRLVNNYSYELLCLAGVWVRGYKRDFRP